MVAIDGKSLNGSYDRESSLKSLVMVSAWSDRHKLVLGQVAVEQKSNEIKAIPLLLEQLDLKGAIITMDAMGTQTAIARQINSAGADYILTLKANHPTLAQDARNWWEKYSQEAEKTLVKTTECICEAGDTTVLRSDVSFQFLPTKCLILIDSNSGKDFRL